MSVDFEISPDVLIWAEQQITSKTDEQISSLLNKWIRKEEVPNTSSIRRVSKALRIPFGYFFLEYPPQEECSLIHYRTIDSTANKNPSRNLVDIYNAMVNAQNWMSDYNRQVLNLDSLPFVGNCSKNDSPVEVASSIRKELDLPIDFFLGVKKTRYFHFLRDRISELGVLVMKNSVVGADNKRKLNIEEFRAFALVDSYAPLIFINSNDSENGKIFSLVHELAHILFGTDSLFNDNYSDKPVSNLEKICNAVAAEFLVPISFFKSEWVKSKDVSFVKISSLADMFHCSELVIARRALDLHFISLDIYKEVLSRTKKQFEMLQRANRYRTSRGGGDFYNTLKAKWDKNFVKALDSSVKAGNTPYLDAYRLMGIKGSTFHKFMSMA